MTFDTFLDLGAVFLLVAVIGGGIVMQVTEDLPWMWEGPLSKEEEQ